MANNRTCLECQNDLRRPGKPALAGSYFCKKHKKEKDKQMAEGIKKYGPFPRPCHCGEVTIEFYGHWYALTSGNHYWHGCFLYPKTSPCPTCGAIGRQILVPAYTVNENGTREMPMLSIAGAH